MIDNLQAPDAALKHLENKIRDAWLDVRTDKRAEALAMRSYDGAHQITVDIAGGDKGDPFACQPSFGLINMKWWALEILWLVAFSFHELGGRLAVDAENGMICQEIETDPVLETARNALAHAARIIEDQASSVWPDGLPSPRDNNTQACTIATETFIAALGWIQQHEVKHIILDRDSFSGTDIDEELVCDTHANDWLLSGSNVSGRAKEGVAVALFFLVLREAIMGKAPNTHPSSSDRVKNSNITNRHSAWLSVLIDILLQSGNHETPATRKVDLPLKDLLVAELDTLDKVLQNK